MKLQGIEAARGVAALLVVLRHATVILADPAAPDRLAFGGFFMFGRAGVEFFFVLSGFIMVYVHRQDLGKPSAFREFWRKRILRIYPPYWVATAVLGAILVFSPTRDGAERSGVHWLLSLLLLPEAHDPVLDVGWSLRHEMLFYVLFSLMILNRTLGFVVMSLWLCGIVAGLTMQLLGNVSFFPGQSGQLLFRGFNVEFFFGMATAVLVRRPSWHPRVILSCGLALFLTVGLIESFGPAATEWPPRILGYAFAGAMILYGVAQLDKVKAWNVPAALLLLGRTSYSVYLVHVVVLLIVGQVFRRLGLQYYLASELRLPIAVAGAVAAGIVFSLLIERPILRLGRHSIRPA